MVACVVAYGRRWLLAASLTLLAACGGTTAPPAMLDGYLAPPPAGWLDFCERNRDDPYCQAPAITAQRLDELARVQREVAALGLRTDNELFRRADFWAPAGPAGGDCEDHALAARARLLALGWPARALRLATAWTETGDFHTVLTIDGRQRGRPVTLVIDNRFARVVDWQALTARGYRWDRRQAAGRPFWVTVVAAVRSAGG